MKKHIFIFFFGALFLGGYAQKPTSWELTGNAGTNPPSHFIGTTGCEGLVFKTNGIERMRLITKTALGIGTTAPQALLHLHQPKNDMGCAPATDTDPVDILLPIKLLQLTTYTATNGLNVSYSNTDIAFTQQEKGNLTLEGLGGGLTIAPDGNVGIGTNSPQATLDVDGNTNITGTVNAKTANINGLIRTKEINVTLSGWGDHVFDEDYNLMPLVEVAQYIKENHHLPEIPSAKEVVENGVELGDMQRKLIMKIEELTLYILQQEKKMLDMQNQINELKK